MKIDWHLLRTQKEWLLRQPCEEADGLLALLDALQDEAVQSGECSQYEVFGFGFTS